MKRLLVVVRRKWWHIWKSGHISIFFDHTALYRFVSLLIVHTKLQATFGNILQIDAQHYFAGMNQDQRLSGWDNLHTYKHTYFSSNNSIQNIILTDYLSSCTALVFPPKYSPLPHHPQKALDKWYFEKSVISTSSALLCMRTLLYF